MLKEERHTYLINSLNEKQVIRVNEIKKDLDVTDMTIRRDLDELESQGILVRVHGGAKLVSGERQSELSHIEKQELNLSEKKEIAKKMANEIKSGDVIFLGTGTTVELLDQFIEVKDIKIITNSLYVFNKFKNNHDYDLVLVGGTYREKTGSFVGTIANDTVKSLHVHKAFIGVNALTETSVFNANEEEGVTQKLILDNASVKYIVSDDSKFNKRDFYNFYDLTNIDYLITNSNVDKSLLEQYQKNISII